MSEQRACSCCKRSVQIVDRNGLCFACNMFRTFAETIQEHTGLTDEESLDLAGELQESVLSELIERLQLSGQDHPLAAELLQMMELRERPN